MLVAGIAEAAEPTRSWRTHCDLQPEARYDLARACGESDAWASRRSSGSTRRYPGTGPSVPMHSWPLSSRGPWGCRTWRMLSVRGQPVCNDDAHLGRVTRPSPAAAVDVLGASGRRFSFRNLVASIRTMRPIRRVARPTRRGFVSAGITTGGRERHRRDKSGLSLRLFAEGQFNVDVSLARKLDSCRSSSRRRKDLRLRVAGLAPQSGAFFTALQATNPWCGKALDFGFQHQHLRVPNQQVPADRLRIEYGFP